MKRWMILLNRLAGLVVMANRRSNHEQEYACLHTLYARTTQAIKQRGQRIKDRFAAEHKADKQPTRVETLEPRLLFSSVAHWTLDDHEGSTITDSSLSAIDIDAGSSPDWNHDAKLGGGINFNGIDDYFDAGNDAAINVTKDYAISAWIKPDDVAGVKSIVSKVTDSTDKQYFLSVRDGQLSFEVEANNNGWILNAGAITTGTWQHVAVTVDASLLATLYIDGVSVGSDTLDDEPLVKSDTLAVGKLLGTYNGYYFDGVIDDVRVYDNALTSTEISNLYSLNLPVVTVVLDNTQPLNEGVATAGTFTFTRTGSTVGNLVVNYAFAPSANSADPSDFIESLSGSITILDGQSSATLPLTPQDDVLVEGTEYVDLKITPSADYSVGSEYQGLMTIDDDEAPNLLLAEDFENGLTGWSFEGVNYNWHTAGGELAQTNYDWQSDTRAFWDNPAALLWTDYVFEADLRSSDNDTIGVVFGYQDSSNYYRFAINHRDTWRRLEKIENGNYTLLAESVQGYVTNQDHHVKIQFEAGVIRVEYDGQDQFGVIDDTGSGTAITSGTVGFYNAWNSGSYYDNVSVISIANNGAPTIDIPATATLVGQPAGTVQLAVGASDPEANGLTYAWSVVSAPAESAVAFDNVNGTSAASTITAEIYKTGEYIFEVAVTDEYFATTTSTVTVSLQATQPLPPLLVEDFTDGHADWTFSGSGNWYTANGELVQNVSWQSNTLAFWDNASAFNWSDYIYESDLRSSGSDNIGVIFGYQDSSNYYRFRMNKRDWFRKLEKFENGSYTLLAEDQSQGFNLDQDYQVAVQFEAGVIRVAVDGQDQFGVVDDTAGGNALMAGTVGYYSEWNKNSYFDGARVFSLEDNVAPTIDTPATATLIDQSLGMIELGVTASDSNLDTPLHYTWEILSAPADAAVSFDAANGTAVANTLSAMIDRSGSYIFQVMVTDPWGASVSDTVTIAPTTVGLPFTEDFSDGDAAGWAFSGPGSWSVTGGELAQTGNEENATAIWSAPEAYAWSDYGFEANVRSADNDTFALVFGYQNEDNHYRFEMKQQETWRRFVKVEDGNSTLLSENLTGYATGQDYHVWIEFVGGMIRVEVDGVDQFGAVADSTHTQGTIGFKSWWNDGTYFDNIVVAASGDNVAPTISNPAVATVLEDPDGLIELSVGAADVNSHAQLRYTWEMLSAPSDAAVWFDAANGTGAADTLTATVSHAGSYTFQVTVSDPWGASVTDIATIALTSTGLPFIKNFDDGDASGWTFTDSDTSWSVSGGELTQTGNGDSTAIWSNFGAYTWSDYAFEANVRSADNDTFALVFGYQDEDNHYRFEMNRQTGWRKLVKTESGISSDLAYVDLSGGKVGYVENQDYHFRIEFVAGTIRVELDGVDQLGPVVHTSHSQGTIGFKTWGNDGTHIDNIVVVSAGDNVAPTISTPATATVVDDPAGLIELSVAVADANPDGPHRYTWEMLSAPTGANVWLDAANGSDDASTLLTTVDQAGSYTFQVTANDPWGASATDTVTVALTSASQPFGDMSANLIGHWTFDDHVGSTVTDISISGNDGTLKGDASIGAGVGAGSALVLDGDGDTVKIDSDSSLDIAANQDFTLSAWINPTTWTPNNGDGMRIFSRQHGNNPYGGYWIRVMPDGKLQMGNKVGTASSEKINSASTISLNEWHHVVGVREGDTLKLYIDGAEEGSLIVTPGALGSGGSVHIGGYQTGAENFNGLIDDVRMYDDALNGAEVSYLHSQSPNQQISDPAVTIAGPATSDEGSPITFTSTLTDAGAGGPFTYAWISTKDGITYDLSGVTTDSDTLAFTPNDNGAYQVSLTVTDSDGGIGTDDFVLTVNNAAPMVSVDTPLITAEEGSLATLGGQYVDPGSDIVTLIASVGIVVDNGNGTWSWSHTPAEGPHDTQVVVITATDEDGLATSVDFDLVVTPTPTTYVFDMPFDGPGGYWGYNGASLELTDQLGLPGDNSSMKITGSTHANPFSNRGGIKIDLRNTGLQIGHTYEIGYWAQGLQVGGNLYFSHQSGQGGNTTLGHTRSVTTDWQYYTREFTLNKERDFLYIWSPLSNGLGYEFAIDNITIEHLNAPPAVSADQASVTVVEGSPVSMTGLYSDQDGDAVTLSASIGVVTDNGSGTWSWTHALDDGPDDTQTVTITAADTNGSFSTISFDLVVTNAAPTATIAGPSNVSEGTEIVFTSTVTDPGVNDTHTYAWSATKDGVAYDLSGVTTDTETLTLTPTDSGSYVMSLIVTDNDGAATTEDYTVTVSDPSLLAHWSFDDGSGDIAADLSGNQNHADRNTATWADDAARGSALEFDGSTSYAEADFVLDPSATAFTASAWVKLDQISATESKVILSQKDVSGIGRGWLYIGTGGTLQSYFGGIAIIGSSTVQTATWHHVAVTHDGTNLRLYLDGQEVADTPVTIESTVGGMVIGAHKSTTQLFLDGLIDDVRIYDRALAESELQSLATPMIAIAGPAGVEEGVEAIFTSTLSDTWGNGSFTYVWSATKDGVAYDLSGITTDTDTLTFTPSDNGAYGVSLTVTDNDGGVTTDDHALIVTNVTPVVSLTADDNVRVGEPYTIQFSATDPGDDTISQWTIDWGPEVLTYPSTSTQATYAYATAGPRTISVTAADEDGDSDPAIIELTVFDLIDDGDFGYTEQSGIWAAGQGDLTSVYGGDYRTLDQSGAGEATWEFVGLAAGGYWIYASHLADPSHATDAGFSVLDGDASTGTLVQQQTIDQTAAPEGREFAGKAFQLIGFAEITGGELTIQLTPGMDPTALTVADAVAIAPAKPGDVVSVGAPTLHPRPDDIDLTAEVYDPASVVTSVAFYHDVDGDKRLDTAVDEWLGVDSDGTDGWGIAAPTLTLPLGEVVLLAQATDGSAPVVFEGVGPYAVTDLYRGDLIYTNTFDAGDQGITAPGVVATWSDDGRQIAPNGQEFLSPFGNDQLVNLSLDGLPQHEQLTVSFDLHIIGTWDGNEGTETGGNYFGPDHWQLFADNTVLLDASFSNHPFFVGYSDKTRQSYGGPNHPQGAYDAGTGGSIGDLGYTLNYTALPGVAYPSDTTYRLTFTIDHTDADVDFDFLGPAHRGDGDETWGIDNVLVTAGTSEDTAATGYVWHDLNENGIRDIEIIDPATGLDFAFVIDISGSTIGNSFGDVIENMFASSGGVDGQINDGGSQEGGGDGIANTVLDGEIQAFMLLYQDLVNKVIAEEIPGDTSIELIVFGTQGAAPISVNRIDSEIAAHGVNIANHPLIEELRDLVAGQDYDLTPNNLEDDNFLGGATSFKEALATTIQVLSGSSGANVIFLTDGWHNTPTDQPSDFIQEVYTLRQEMGANLYGFGAGTNVSLRFLKYIDQNAEIFTRGSHLVESFDRLVENTLRFAEPALAGWRVYADLNDDGQWTADEPSALSNFDGTYTLQALPLGTYDISTVSVEDWDSTWPVSGAHTIVVEEGVLIEEQNFGLATQIKPELSFTVTKGDLDETKVGDFAEIEFRSSFPVFSDLTIDLNIEGVGIDGSDHDLPSSVTMLAGTDIAIIRFGATDDGIIEGNETMSISLAESLAYEIALGQSAGFVTIYESDITGDNLDTDLDGITDADEVFIYGTNPTLFDSDGDMLGDGFEINNPDAGLDPLAENDPHDDFDGDGLTDLEEQIHGTKPGEGDSDGDGVDDSTEVFQGSDPSDASDEGESPAEDMFAELNLKVGDFSGSQSEQWELKVGAKSHSWRVFGEVSPWTPYLYEKGQTYDVTMKHLGTDPAFVGQDDFPDFDYTALIEWGSKPGVAIIDNTQGLLQERWYAGDDPTLGGPNDTIGKSAKVHIVLVDLDIITPEPIDDKDEDDPGGPIEPNADNDDGDLDGNGNPILDFEDTDGVEGEDDLVTLELKALIPAEIQNLDGTLTLEFSGDIKIWLDEQKNDEVESGVTTFDVAEAHTLYAEAAVPAGTLFEEQISAVYVPGALPEGYIQLGTEERDTITLFHKPTVSIFAVDAYAAEADLANNETVDNATFLISRGEGSTEGNLEVFYVVKHELDTINHAVDFTTLITSTFGADYTENLIQYDDDGTYYGKVTIPHDHSTIELTVTPIDDSVKEWDEIIQIALVTPNVVPTDFSGQNPELTDEKKNYYLLEEGGEESELAEVTIFDNDVSVEAVLNRNVDTESTGLFGDSIVAGAVSADLYQGAVTLALPLKPDGYGPIYQGDDNLVPLIPIEIDLTDFTGNDVFDLPDAMTAKVNFGGVEGESFTITGLDQIVGETEKIRLVLVGPDSLAEKLRTGHYDYDISLEAEIDEETVTRTIHGNTEIFNRFGNDHGDIQYGKGWWVAQEDRLIPDDGTTGQYHGQGLAAGESGVGLFRGDSTTAWYVATTDYSQLTRPDSSSVSAEEDWMDSTLIPVSLSDVDGEENKIQISEDGTYSWNFSGLELDEMYQVFATWTPGETREAAAKYTVDLAVDLNNPNADTVEWQVDQRYTPGELVIDGQYFRSLGFITPDDNAISVTLDRGTFEEGEEPEGYEEGELVAHQESILLVQGWTYDTPLGTLGTASELLYEPEETGSSDDSRAVAFNLATKYGTTYEFGADGKLHQRVDRNDNATRLEYNDDGLLEKITEQGGLETKYEYTEGKIVEITDFSGRQISYEVSDSIDFIIEPVGYNDLSPQTFFVYGGPDGRLNQVIDAEGNVTGIEYDSDTKRVNSITAPGTPAVTIAPFLADGLNAVYMPAEGTSDGFYNSADLMQPKAVYTDARGNDWLYQMDGYGLTIAMANPLGIGNVWQWTRDDDGLVTESIEPAGGGGIVSLGALTTKYIYDATDEVDSREGNLERIEYAQAKQSGGGNISESWTYGAFNQIATYKNGRDIEIEYILDPATGNISEIIEKDTLGNAGGNRATKINEYTAAPSSITSILGGLIKSVTAAHGTSDAVTSLTEYWESGVNIGLVKREVYASGTNVETDVEYAYDLNRNPEAVKQTDARITTYGYDDLDRLTIVSGVAPGVGSSTHNTPSTLYDYDLVNNLTAVIDAQGNQTQYDYDEMNRLIQVLTPAPGGHSNTDSGQGKTEYRYDANGNLEYIDVYTDGSTKRTTKNVYDERNLLVMTEFASPGYSAADAKLSDGQEVRPTIVYEYDTLGNLKSESDARYGDEPGASVKTTYEYDKLHRLVKTTSPQPSWAFNAPVVSYDYYDDGSIETITSPSPASQTETVDTSYIYDSFGRLKQETPPADGKGNQLVVNYTYDRRDNLKTVTEAGNGKSRITTNYYDALNRMIAQDGPDAAAGKPGVSAYYSYNVDDDLAAQLIFAGDITASHVSDGRITLAEINTHQNTVWGRATNNIAQETEFKYDNLGRVYEVEGPQMIADESNTHLTSVYTYDAASNVTQTQVKFTEGGSQKTLTTNVEYDHLNRAWRILSPAIEGGDRPETQIAFYQDGNVKAELVKNTNDSNGWYATAYGYDGLGRVSQVSVEDSAATSGTISSSIWRDALGNVTRTVDHFGLESVLEYDRAGLLSFQKKQQPAVYVSSTNTTLPTADLNTFYRYNHAGVMTRVAQTGLNVSFGETTYEYDNHGKVTKQTQAINDSNSAETLFEYDVYGNRDKVTDSEGNTTTFTTDNLGRVTEDSISFGDREYQYDSFGNVIHSEDRNDKEITFVYNNQGLLAEELWGNGSSYDAYYEYSPLGELKSADNDDADYDYTYDAGRRLDTLIQDTANVDVTFTYDFDLVGNLVQVDTDFALFSGDYRNTYEYDSRNRLKEVSQAKLGTLSTRWIDPKTLKFDYRYTSYITGDLSGTKLLEAITRRYENDGSGAVTASTKQLALGNGHIRSIHHYTGDIPSNHGSNTVTADSILRELLQTDVRGLLTYQGTSVYNDTTDSVETSVTNNTYDRFGQITQVQVNPTGPDNTETVNYTYDDNGNRVGTSSETAGHNRLVFDGKNTYEYDAEGNLTYRWSPIGNSQLGNSAAFIPITGSEMPDDETLQTAEQTLNPGFYRLDIQSLSFDDDDDNDMLFNAVVKVDSNIVDYVFNIPVVYDPATDTWIASESDTAWFELPDSGSPYENVRISVEFSTGGGLMPNLIPGSYFTVTQASELEHFEYDHRNRLIKASIYRYGEAYEDLTTATITRAAPGTTTSPTMKLVDEKAFAYDALGQLIYEDRHAYKLDSNNNTTDTQYTFAYTVERGQRVAKRVLQFGDLEQENTVYLWTPNADILLAAEVQFNFLGDGEIVWPLNGHQGTTLAALSDGEVIRWETNGFGLPELDSLTSEQIVAVRNLGVFSAGRFFDFELDLYYNRARWYDPGTGRFTSTDPLGYAAGDTNLYRYVFNSPTNGTDPSGQIAFIPILAWTAGSAALSYIAMNAAFAVAETGIEYGETSAFGSDADRANFSVLGAFGKNFGINLATAGFGGKAKAGYRLSRLAGMYAARQGIEIGGETAYDVGYHNRNLGSSLAINTIGSIAGEGIARGAAAGLRKFNANYRIGLNPATKQWYTSGLSFANPNIFSFIKIKKRVHGGNADESLLAARRKLHRTDTDEAMLSRATDEFLMANSKGRRIIQPNPDQHVLGAGAQGDRIINGSVVEYKHPVPSASVGTLLSRLRSSLSGDAQSRHIVFDVRSTGLSSLDVQRFLQDRSVISTLGTQLDAIEVIGDEFYTHLIRAGYRLELPRPSHWKWGGLG